MSTTVDKIKSIEVRPSSTQAFIASLSVDTPASFPQDEMAKTQRVSTAALKKAT